jgi:hypothetical protein
MNNGLFILLRFLGIVLSVSALDSEIDETLKKGIPSIDWESKPVARKTEIISALRGLMLNANKANDIYFRQKEARRALLNLGDSVAIEDTMRIYRGRYYTRFAMAELMSQTSQPLLIPLLSEDLALEAPANFLRKEGEALVPPRSVTSSGVIVKILANMPETSVQVKQWARLLDPKQPEQLLNEVRAFWKKNAPAFAAKDYAKVEAP